MEIGFVGLGRMGLGMANNLAKAGHKILAWNRSPVAADAIPGGRVVASPAEAFQADAVFTMLSDDPAIRAVILDAGLLDGARPGLVHVVASTISVAFADELARRHADAGFGYVSAPVFGRPDMAEAGRLDVVAAGAPAAIGTVRPLLDAIGQRTVVIGDRPNQANAAKLAGNMMLAMAIEALAEGIALTGAHGIEPQAFVDLMLQTLFGCRAYETYGAKIVAGDFDPGFRLSLGLKDLRLATEAAPRPLPMLDAVRAQMTQAAEAHLQDTDNQSWQTLRCEDRRQPSCLIV